MKILKNKEGITLVALVITIIVLLILAGVTISMVFGDNGIIGRAENAANMWNKAREEEEEGLNSLYDEMGNYIGETEYLSVGKTATGNKEYKDGNGDIVTVPDGFKVSSEGTTIDDGLVIEDSIGNQFVWIPVDGTNVTYTKWDGSITNVLVSSTSDDDLPSKVTSEWGQTETSQITKYGGFYIARYEAGIPDTLSTALTTASLTERNVTGTPVSKKNQVPWNYINYTNSKVNAESMYSTDYVQSGLVTGTMWDTVMLWLENSGYNVQANSTSWGNYSNAAVTGIDSYSTDYGESWTSATTKPSGSSYILKTGNSDYTSAKNIYDLAGNLWEWTNENYSSDCVNRGRCLQLLRQSAPTIQQLTVTTVV